MQELPPKKKMRERPAGKSLKRKKGCKFNKWGDHNFQLIFPTYSFRGRLQQEYESVGAYYEEKKEKAKEAKSRWERSVTIYRECTRCGKMDSEWWHCDKKE